MIDYAEVFIKGMDNKNCLHAVPDSIHAAMRKSFHEDFVDFELTNGNTAVLRGADVVLVCYPKAWIEANRPKEGSK